MHNGPWQVHASGLAASMFYYALLQLRSYSHTGPVIQKLKGSWMTGASTPAPCSTCTMYKL